VGIEYGSTEDGLDYQEYLKFSAAWMKRCHALAKPDGRFCLNIPLDKNKGGHNSIYADFVTVAKESGWNYFTTIIWNEGNISRRTAWGSWMSASAPYIIAPVEMIAVFYKEQWKKQAAGVSDISKENFMEWTNGLWTFNGESKKRIGHPAPFPLELPKRCIQLFSYVGDTVLDPFMGSGTTLIACGQLGRAGVGVDIDEDYCKLAVRRFQDALCQQKLFAPGESL
jgi:site-specific DNA-methyltransferase (adenine-specific)